jgi:hypothetical protein
MAVGRYTITRHRSGDGTTLFFAIWLGSRSRGWKFFHVGELPDFEGEEAIFEMDRAKGAWRVVRQVPNTIV